MAATLGPRVAARRGPAQAASTYRSAGASARTASARRSLRWTSRALKKAKATRRRSSGRAPAGSEKTGPAASSADLFVDRTTVVTPADADTDAVDETVRFWESLGSRVVKLEPDEHDRLLAHASHLPHLLALRKTPYHRYCSPNITRLTPLRPFTPALLRRQQSFVWTEWANGLPAPSGWEKVIHLPLSGRSISLTA